MAKSAKYIQLPSSDIQLNSLHNNKTSKIEKNKGDICPLCRDPIIQGNDSEDWPLYTIRDLIELYTVKPVLRGHHWDKEKVAL